MLPEKRKEFLSIPNIMCYIRLLLLPWFAYLYCSGELAWATAVILLSAATDVLDGIVARKFNMTTEVGKVLDPLADKLTQAVVSACLLSRYRVMWILFLIILVKESFQGIGGLLLYRKVHAMRSSEWFGKLSTAFFYAVMAYLVLFNPDPDHAILSTLPILASAALMLFALVRYGHRFVQVVSGLKKQPAQEPLTEK